MSVIRPRRGEISLSSTLGADRKDREQIRRLLSQPQKPPKTTAPVVATGGGVVGMAEVIATAGSVTWQAGSRTNDFESVTYSTVRDPNAGSGGGESKVPVESWLTVSGYQITLAPGWYIPVLNMRMMWQGGGHPPTFGGPYMHGGWDIAHNDFGIHPATSYDGTLSGLWQIANYGPTYMGDGTNLHAECRAFPVPSAANNAAESAIIWNITKLG